MPVIADIKVVPEHIDIVFQKLAQALQTLQDE
jgi:hypothetical protein